MVSIIFGVIIAIPGLIFTVTASSTGSKELVAVGV